MKKFLLILGLCCAPLALTSCNTAPTQRVVEVQTLKAVGQSADAVVALAAHLYQAGTITAAQAKTVADFYDTRFQPAYRLAVVAVQADLSTEAPQDLINLASQLSNLLLSFRNHTAPTVRTA